MPPARRGVIVSRGIVLLCACSFKTPVYCSLIEGAVQCRSASSTWLNTDAGRRVYGQCIDEKQAAASTQQALERVCIACAWDPPLSFLLALFARSLSRSPALSPDLRWTHFFRNVLQRYKGSKHLACLIVVRHVSMDGLPTRPRV